MANRTIAPIAGGAGGAHCRIADVAENRYASAETDHDIGRFAANFTGVNPNGSAD